MGVKVEFIKTTFDAITKQTYRAGTVTEIDEALAAHCEILGATRYVNSNVSEVAEEIKKEVEAAKEEEKAERDAEEKTIEKALIKEEEEFNLIEYVKGLKLAELKEFVKTNNVNLKGKTKKADILDVILAEIRKG